MVGQLLPFQEGGDACGFDLCIKPLMIRPESFVMASVTWFALSVENNHQSRFFRIPSNSARNLNILGSRLGLPDNRHESQSGI
jgi:hypothetical protein